MYRIILKNFLCLYLILILGSVLGQNNSGAVPILQNSHRTAINHLSEIADENVVLSTDQENCKLWNTKTNDILKTFYADYASFDGEDNIITLTKIGDDQSILKKYDTHTLLLDTSITIQAEPIKVYFNSDKTRLLVNSGTDNYSVTGNSIIDLPSMTIIKEFKAFDAKAYKNLIAVILYKDRGRRLGKHAISVVNFQGELLWRKNVGSRFVGYSSPKWAIIEDKIVFDEFTYILGMHKDYNIAYDIETGKKSKNRHSLFDHFDYLHASNFYCTQEVYNYAVHNPAKSKWNSTNHGDVLNIKAFLGSNLHTEYSHPNFKDSCSYFTINDNNILLGYENGVFQIYSLAKDAIIFESKVAMNNIIKVETAAMTRQNLYLFTDSYEAYQLNLKSLGFSPLEVAFKPYDVIISANYEIDQSLVYSEEYMKGYPVSQSSNKFSVVNGNIISEFKGRPLAQSNDKNRLLADLVSELMLHDFSNQSENKLPLRVNQNDVKSAEFSPDGKYLILVIAENIYLVDTKNLDVLKYNTGINPNATDMFKGSFSEQEYLTYTTAKINWMPQGDRFYVTLGSLIGGPVFSGFFDLNLKFLGKGKLSASGKYRVTQSHQSVKYQSLADNQSTILVDISESYNSIITDVIPNRFIVNSDDGTFIYSITNNQKVQLEKENYVYNSLIEYDYAKTSNGELLISQFYDSDIEIYDLKSGELLKAFKFPKGSYNYLKIKNKNVLIVYDYIYRGQFFSINLESLEMTEYSASELPLFSSNLLVGKVNGYFSQYGDYYSDMDRHFEARDIKNGVQLTTPNSDYVMTKNQSGELSIYHLKTSALICKVLLGAHGYILITPDNYYSKSPDFKEVKFSYNKKLYPYEQFDLKYNRPDIILQRLGLAESKLINAYYRAYQKRLKKMGFTEDMLKDDFHLPEIKIKNLETFPKVIENDEIQLTLKMNDSKYPLDRINVWINDVAILGTNGISLRDLNIQNLDKKINLPLARGKNKIQVSVLNQAGAESYQETLEIECTVGKDKPNLYLISIGSSQFKQKEYNLTYAAKDAKNIVETLQRSEVYDTVYSELITNSEVTEQRIKDLRIFLKNADINDQVIIFIANHGVLDEQLDYYLGTYDINFSNPSENGIAYEDLENLLDGIMPLKKSLLLDACHSGEIDKEEVQLAVAENTESSDVKFRAVGNPFANKLGSKNTLELSKSLFTDLRRGTGATVLSSAGGMEYAIESDRWKNGLFTYTLLNGIESGNADLNNDGEIWLSELKKYVSEQVTVLSDGKQQPTSRIENQSVDFRVW